jgi:hypothetical protein
VQEHDEHAFAAIVQEATCETYNFLCRARSDEYNVRCILLFLPSFLAV